MNEKEPKLNIIEGEFKKVGTYKGYDILTYPLVAKEDVATMFPDSNNISVAIAIRPDAYEILKARPDYLERIYEHEIRENVKGEDVHGQQNNDDDIIEFLINNGYDFGDFDFKK